MGPPAPSPPAPSSTAADAAAAGDSDGGLVDARDPCAGPPHASCGLTTITVTDPPLPPDILIVLDKSSSMRDQWDAVTTVLLGEVIRTQADIKWGLAYFPSDGACGTAAAAGIPPAANNAAAIVESIAMTSPGGNTPTRAALQAGAAYLTSLADASTKHILLVTDGASNCCTTAGGATCPATPTSADGEDSLDDASNAVTAVAAVYAQGSGIPVLVMGVGSTETAMNALNFMAIAGGVSRAPDVLGRVYVPADDPAALRSLLATTMPDLVASCMFTLPKPPADPSNVVVLADGTRIPRDPVNGWSYGQDMATIVLNGVACDALKSGRIHQVTEIAACPPFPICIP